MAEREGGIAEPAALFIRLRPLARQGGHAGRVKGEAARKPDLKRLAGHTAEDITVADLKTGQQTSFNYMERVLGPATDQETAWTELGLPRMLDKVTAGYSAAFLAYGQTGTGKTHTMFGSQLDQVASWAGGESYPAQWGVFPRAVMELLARLQGRRVLLTANIVEIYFWQAFDLLNQKAELNWGQNYDGTLEGVRQMEVRGPQDIAKIIGIMHTYRQSRSTVMNDTSSRSHCLARLNLSLVGEVGTVTRSTLTFVDLAGSERLDKTELESKSSTAAYEGLATNWDLFHFSRTIELAMQAAKKGKKLDKWIGRESVLAVLLAASLKGETLFSLVICLSQSEKNGGESWCSLKFGETASKLRVEAESAQPEKVEKLISSTKQV